MRNPERVLNSLGEHSKNSSYKFERLYRLFFNEELFFVAYQRIYAKAGNMTKGADGETIDKMSLSRITKLITSLKDESYQPTPSRRTYIPKKDGKKRPLGIPSFNDKLVQEVLRMILESIFERQFENSSHGFRPHRSCHTALKQVQKNFTATKWFIEGDIKGFFDNIKHDVLIGILHERIDDDRFLRLIRKFLNAGYVEDWMFHKTFSGTPQGGIVSPILANIYLDKLDKYMKEYTDKFDKGSRRKDNAEYFKLSRKIAKLNYKLDLVKDESEKLSRIAKINSVKKERLALKSVDEMDSGYKRIKYVRYADDFLVGVIGSKEDSEAIKKDIKQFLSEKLQLELSEDKTLITHANKSAQFLGYEIYIRKTSTAAKRSKKTGILSRVFDSKVVLHLPTETMRRKLAEYEVLKMVTHNGSQIWRPLSRTKLINNDDLEIIDTYNAEIRGFYNYYALANNSASVNDLFHIMQYSMFKTFAKKYRITTRQAIAKLRIGKSFGAVYNNRKGERKVKLFYNAGFKRKTEVNEQTGDNLPSTIMNNSTTSLKDRLQARVCELCGSTDDLEMHHVRKLKDVARKQPWEILMHARRRKTMAVCHSCHKRIHGGKMD
ncbi:group II intron reverse transcriptase/maturase [Sphingobacterium sp. UME9]|nr:group II intron reverse transcriptase/maturase [Sphingobacterium sp. UME9]MBB1642768.1 group II intron reverse transcriptase/maturase [Sphingobacterium sp. UME9]